jgi:hypothetical protein
VNKSLVLGLIIAYLLLSFVPQLGLMSVLGKGGKGKSG